MGTMNSYMAGCNLGHWISQYGGKGAKHWDSYITEPDFARMAEWGIDHVRLPVDYFIFEKDENPGVYLEDGLKYIDSTIEWSKKYGLNVVLDLHHAPGFFFGNGEKNDLFTNAESKMRYINIWKNFARRYAQEGTISALNCSTSWSGMIPNPGMCSGRKQQQQSMQLPPTGK